jgi:hypothetical protein
MGPSVAPATPPRRRREKLVTRADYAQMRGCSRAAVTRAVQRGQITLVRGLVDVHQADEQWPRTERRRPSRPRQPKPPAQTSAPNGNGAAPTTDRSYWDRRAETEKHRALLTELELKERLGDLVDRKTVEQSQTEAYRVVRERLETISDRVSAALVGKTEPEIRAVVDAEVGAVLDELDGKLCSLADL